MSLFALGALPERLKQAREAQGLTALELSRLADTRESDIHRWERGHCAPHITKLVKLADALDVSIDWLAGRTS